MQWGRVWRRALGWKVKISDGHGGTKRTLKVFWSEVVLVVVTVQLRRLSSDYVNGDPERAEEVRGEANGLNSLSLL